jgi:hypothetical protein
MESEERIPTLHKLLENLLNAKKAHFMGFFQNIALYLYSSRNPLKLFKTKQFSARNGTCTRFLAAL